MELEKLNLAYRELSQYMEFKARLLLLAAFPLAGSWTNGSISFCQEKPTLDIARSELGS